MNTPFDHALADWNKTRRPSVYTEQGEIPFPIYQIAVHKMQLKVMSSGMKFRGIQLRHFKDYYGLTGRTAKSCLKELEQIELVYTYEYQQNEQY